MSHPSVSGLSFQHRIEARDLAVKAAILGRQHAPQMFYTQDSPQRWEGIDHHLKAWRRQFPHHADCSGFTTWCLWNGLDHFGVRDVVNGQHWKAGYTGTQVGHGIKVTNGHFLRADLVFYGDPFGETGHVAIHVGDHKVISFGGEPGPRLLEMDYRPVTAVRRYI